MIIGPWDQESGLSQHRGFKAAVYRLVSVSQGKESLQNPIDSYKDPLRCF